MLGKISRDFFTNPSERCKMLGGYAATPLASSVMIVWLTFFLMFFVGVFVPVVGQANITQDGWQIWEVGILGFVGLWAITWFAGVEKPDNPL